jgi:hypothetical protein
MHSVSAAVVLAGPNTSGDISTGIDTADAFQAMPQRARLGVWTNRIESIGAR